MDVYISQKNVAETLLRIFGDDAYAILQKRWQEKFKENMVAYKVAVIRLGNIEAYKTGLDDNIIDKEDIKSHKFRAFQKAKMQYSISGTFISEVLWMLLENTDIKDLPIGQKIIWNVMPKDKKIEERTQERRPMRPEVEHDEMQ